MVHSQKDERESGVDHDATSDGDAFESCASYPHCRRSKYRVIMGVEMQNDETGGLTPFPLLTQQTPDMKLKWRIRVFFDEVEKTLTEEQKKDARSQK